MVTLQPIEYQRFLFRFADIQLQLDTQTEGQQATEVMFGNKTRALEYANRWITDLNLSEIERIQSIPTCRKWIELFHFKIADESHYESFEHISVEQMSSQMFKFPL